jgi:hypothetical protein
MLYRFQKALEVRGITRVQLLQADVLALETLPSSWTTRCRQRAYVHCQPIKTVSYSTG